MLTIGVIIDNEQHIGIALGPAGEFGQGWYVAVPHGAGRDRGQELRHIVGGVLERLLECRAQLRLFVLQARRQTDGKALTSAGRQTVQA
ncbi:hypothetical protein D3C76_1341920 [compost metagenome]